jgi:hypothetical protein
MDLTPSDVHDSAHLPAMPERVEGEVGQVSADKAYDSATCYEAILARGALHYSRRVSSRINSLSDFVDL